MPTAQRLHCCLPGSADAWCYRERRVCSAVGRRRVNRVPHTHNQEPCPDRYYFHRRPPRVEQGWFRSAVAKPLGLCPPIQAPRPPSLPRPSRLSRRLIELLMRARAGLKITHHSATNIRKIVPTAILRMSEPFVWLYCGGPSNRITRLHPATRSGRGQC